MFTILVAYLLIGVFFMTEGRMRKGRTAKSFEAGQADQGSTRVIGLAFGVVLPVLVLAPFLNILRLGNMGDGRAIGAVGLAIMAVGLLIRYWANKTLGAFYSRTLLVTAEQRLVDYGPYRWIRNPGYLGTLLLFVGAGLAATNWIVTAIVMGVLGVAYSYRIRAEEAMLLSEFGGQYKAYMRRSWRLIPLVF
jgi:protein-S-isoprenylcysteine O-methyltransferase Ste14